MTGEVCYHNSRQELNNKPHNLANTNVLPHTISNTCDKCTPVTTQLTFVINISNNFHLLHYMLYNIYHRIVN
jgi:hypothetical protein